MNKVRVYYKCINCGETEEGPLLSAKELGCNDNMTSVLSSIMDLGITPIQHECRPGVYGVMYVSAMMREGDLQDDEF